MFEITLAEQIECVVREIGFRNKLYPRWVDQHKLTQKTADTEIARMMAVLATLRSVQNEERARAAPGSPCTSPR